MKPDLFDILARTPDLDPQRLLDYIEGRLTEADKREVEKLLADSPFDSDALEGLEQVQQKDRLPGVVQDINRQLVKQLQTRRRRPYKKLPDINLPLTVTIIILILVALVYFFIIRQAA